METFGGAVRELRQQLGLTQWQVAERTGVSNTYISALESGRKPAPPHAIVTALAACLQTSEAVLWQLARTEREDRLRRRLDGIPTSQRRPRSSTPKADHSASDPSADKLDEVLDQLRATAKNPAQRRSLAKALEALAKGLRGKD